MHNNPIPGGGRPGFFRAGGIDQLILEKPADMALISGLDERLWVALCCPTKGFDFDQRTLELIDGDNEGFVRCRQLTAAVEWTFKVLSDTSTLAEGSDHIRLGQIDDSHTEGRSILESARRVLANLDKSDDGTISLDDVLDKNRIFAQSPFNGDGVIPESAAQNQESRQVIREIANLIGSSADAAGGTGITEADINGFFAALEAYFAWWRKAHPSDGSSDAAVYSLGDDTPGAFSIYSTLRKKIDDFFERCRIAAYDPRSTPALNVGEDDYKALRSDPVSDLDGVLGGMPLGRIDAEGNLPLQRGINPSYAGELQRFRASVARPILEHDAEFLTESDWKRICQTLQPYANWMAAKKGGEVESLGIERIEIILAGETKTVLLELVAQDRAIAGELAAIDKVERLLRYHCHLFRLVNNFVSFPEFYDTEKQAIFQIGTLFMDGCAFTLCVEVDDRNRHIAIASKSGIFLVYCELRHPHRKPPKRLIAAAVTARLHGHLTVGKNGIFYDSAGRDWNATVVHVISHPISYTQAILAPFTFLGNLLVSQIEKFTATREKELAASVAKTAAAIDQLVEKAAKPDAAAKGAPSEAKPSPGLGGLLAGGGVAIAAISSAFAFITSTFATIDKVYFLYTAILIILLIMLPSLILAHLKLRARNLGLVLEACGWAINGKMRLNAVIAAQLTRVGKLPPDARRVPFAGIPGRPQRLSRRLLVLLLFALIAALGLVLLWP